MFAPGHAEATEFVPPAVVPPTVRPIGSGSASAQVSWQAALLGTWRGPRQASSVSLVQVLPSSALTAACVQVPSTQLSVVAAVPSSHAARWAPSTPRTR